MHKNTNKILTYFIASVWLINGLYCKILNMVPRHQEIVGRILDSDYSALLTSTIGILEVFMALWIVSGFKSRINAVFQMSIIAVMNVIEFYLASDLLLWGKFNAIFALLFITLIGFNEFVFKKSKT